MKPSIIQTLNRYGIEVIEKGGRKWISCPVHLEKTPSAQIYSNDTGFYCFGCGWKGDAIDLIRHMERCSMPEARRMLGIGKFTITDSKMAEKGRRFKSWQSVTGRELADTYRRACQFRDEVCRDAVTDNAEVEHFIFDFIRLLEETLDRWTEPGCEEFRLALYGGR